MSKDIESLGTDLVFLELRRMTAEVLHLKQQLDNALSGRPLPAVNPREAHEAYRQRGSKSLSDTKLEASLFRQLHHLELSVDSIAPTPLRHRLSELIVQMRAEIWSFDQAKSAWR